MAKLKSVFLLITIIISFHASLLADGLEIKLTVSGKLLLGIAYRHQIDANTALRVGSYMGVAGAPVGIQLGVLQDFEPDKKWTPTFGIGVDTIIYKNGNDISNRMYPSAHFGIAFGAQKAEKHCAELWLGRPAKKILPMGMTYSYLAKIF